MRATLMYGARDVRVENVTDSAVGAATRCTRAHHRVLHLRQRPAPLLQVGPARRARRMGHDSSAWSKTPAPRSPPSRGRPRVSLFLWSDKTCEFCREGLHTSCTIRRPVLGPTSPDEGGQAEAIRVPFADGTLVKLPVARTRRDAIKMLTLSDVFGTGHHAARHGVRQRAHPRRSDRRRRGRPEGCSPAKRLGAEQIIPMGRHSPDGPRPRVGAPRVPERGDEGSPRSATSPAATAHTPSSKPSATCPPTNKPSESCARAGSSAEWESPNTRTHQSDSPASLGRNIRLAGGPAPARAYIEALMPDILEGTINPGKVFDATTGIDGVPRRIPGHGRSQEPQGPRETFVIPNGRAIQALRRPLSPSRRVPCQHMYD